LKEETKEEEEESQILIDQSVVGFQPIQLKNSKARIEISRENILALNESQEFLEHMISISSWKQEQFQLYGTVHQESRLVVYFGDTDCNYVSCGETRTVFPWTEDLLKIKGRVEEICNCTFNNATVYYYRNGEDYNGFHDEQTVLASKEKIVYLFLGSDRNFIIKNRKVDEVNVIKVLNGSAIIMYGEETSKNYICCVPKSRSNIGPRLNIIFRNVEKGASTSHQPTQQPIETEGTTV